MRVLVVDDHKAIVDLLEEVLSESHTVQVAQSGEEALEAVYDASYDLVISDIMMPGMSGLDLFVEARKQRPGMRFVFMTASRSPETRLKAIKLGPVGYLEKPFKVQDLHKIIGRMEEEMQLKGFSGKVESLELSTVIHLACVQGSSVLLEVTSNGKKGELVIRSGRVVHAKAGKDNGKGALLKMLKWESGEFELHRNYEPVKETVEESFESILIEAAISQDETGTIEIPR